MRRTGPYVLIVSMLLLRAGTCSSQPDSSRWRDDQGAALFSVVAHDGLTALKAAGHVLCAPTHWSEGDWFVAGGVVGATAASFLADNKVFDLMERNNSTFNDGATSIAVEYGSGTVAIGVPATLYLTGLIFKEPWLRETGVLAGTTIVVASAGTTLGKIVMGRARPYAGLGHSKFKPFNGHDQFMSFPSGHTTAAFALSAVLAARIKDPWATVGLYGIATGAAASRMYTRDHWFSDVVFTAAYTSAVANSIVRWFEGDEKPDGATRSLNIIPTSNGVSLEWRL